jgi:hypothetical protein
MTVGMRRVFLGIFLALGFSLFDGEPALLSTAASANRSLASQEIIAISIQCLICFN